jgi:hypothetical protein
VTELSSPESFSQQCKEIDHKISNIVSRCTSEGSVRSPLQDCPFCVTIADPRQAEPPLIAVSDQFEVVTGYSKAEVIGRNWEDMSHGCMGDPVDLMYLSAACQSGASFSATLTNRRKSGDFFANFLDLNGLAIARNTCTGERLWFLIFIHADVTHVAEEGTCSEEHLLKLQEVARHIRTELIDDFKRLAMAGALMSRSWRYRELDSEIEAEGPCQQAWRMLPEPIWKQQDAKPRSHLNRESSAGQNNSLLAQIVLLAGFSCAAGLLVLSRHGKTLSA